MKKILLISAAALALVLLLVILIPKKNPYPVATKIQTYLDQFEEDELVSVNLANFTDFEWDKVVIFNHPAKADEAKNLTEKEYSQVAKTLYETSLQVGMIFFQNEKLVHFEHFNYDYCENTGFIIYTQKEPDYPHCRTFTLDEAKFEGCYFIYGYHPYTVKYRVYPFS